ncbi:MAG: META domain-containing protein [Candidatus Promineofilum sp.]|nr:META domain-containing protein [Promineifilum sp.]
MKRLLLLVSLTLLLALAACGGAQPSGQELLPTSETVIGELATATPILEAPAEGETGDVVGGNIIPTLAGTTWQWVDTTTPTETIVAVDPARYTITFNEDGTANITADCNSVSANYTTDETGTLTIMPGMSTAVGCPADTQDQLFLSALASATNFFAIDTGNDLYIDLAADAGTMRLQPAAAAGLESAAPTGLTGTTWEWVSVIDPMGQTASADPTRYTITFNEDSTANITADCNTVIAQYVTDGNTLMIMPGASTLVACEPGSQDQLFLSSLSSAASYTVEDGELFVALDAEAGTILFRPAGTAAGGEDAGLEAAPTLAGTTWQWTESATANTATAVAEPARYAVVFNEDGTLAITADCNSMTGAYVAGEDGTLTMTLGASTLMACPEDSQATEFMAALAAAATYSFDGADLVIGQAADAGTLRFQSATAAADTEAGGAGEPTEMTLTGNAWQWVETTTPTETTTVADPTRYTITFNEDGTAAIGADCNQVTATYTVADSALTIVPGASTLALCPEDSQAEPFVLGLSAAAVYFFQDGHLFIDQFASSGTMKFAPVAAAGEEAGEETAEEPGKGETTAPAGGLVGPLWQLTGITQTGGNITINDPTRYTISFNADGTANLVTDCNVGGATYTTSEGNLLTITPGMSTMAFCGVGSFDQIFLGGLTNAQGYRLEEGNLLIDMLYESGTLVFMPAP